MSFSNATPVLRVSDYQRAKTFYMDVLGFSVGMEAGEPIVGFGIFRVGKAQVFLTAGDGPAESYDGWRVYFYPEDFDGFVAALQEKQLAFKGPTTTEYGMVEVEVTDPDGNVLCFGKDAG
ncbi:hypothetical protein GFB49_13345 [Epibacterium sp. SM1979]|uniref:VOC domain-containing protein n=1 Tax=Tritonibacter litoralis TaxID=2662264 RepID=A0A843YL85_9RHOB|nr:glyoxalase superfamily protein [Tritonibacter litoralis]MQQ09447.1 hypothetical protein [Tritonibacter litoralis]